MFIYLVQYIQTKALGKKMHDTGSYYILLKLLHEILVRSIPF